MFDTRLSATQRTLHDELIRLWETSGQDWSADQILQRVGGDEVLAREVAASIAKIDEGDFACEQLLRQACLLDEGTILVANEGLGASDASGDDQEHGTVALDNGPWPSRDSFVPRPLIESMVSSIRLSKRAHLATGGLGIVWVYHDETLGRDVAVKFLNPQHATSRQQYELFQREAEITAKLDHPGVPPVLATGESDSGQPYFVMRLISGHGFDVSIAQLHQTAKKDRAKIFEHLRGVINQFAAVCRIVDYARTRRVVHGDVKPANVRVDRHGEVMLLDWGMATVVDRQVAGPGGPLPTIQLDRKTMDQAVVGGTLCYMSPEVFAGGAPSPSIDIYSLGVILYEILTGDLPLQPIGMGSLSRAERQDFAQRVLNAEYPDIETASLKALGEFPGRRDLCAIAKTALAVKPTERYQTSLALADDLEHFLADRPVSVRKPTLTTRLVRQVRRHKWLAMSLVSVLLVTVLSLLTINWNQRRSSAKLLVQQFKTEQMARDAASQRDLAMQTLASFAADQVVGEIGARYHVLRQAVQDPRLVAELQHAIAQPEHDGLSDWLESQFEQTAATTRADSWFVMDTDGYQRGRYPRSQTIGKRYSHRNYFHGRNIELDEGEFEGMVHSPYLSTVYVSESTGLARVALVYPIIHSGEKASRRFIGLLGMSINLDSFATLHVPETANDVNLLLVDARRYRINDRMASGVILHHGNHWLRSGDEGKAISMAPASWLNHHEESEKVWVGWQPTVEQLSNPDRPEDHYTAIATLDWRDIDRRNHLGTIRLPDWLVVVQR